MLMQTPSLTALGSHNRLCQKMLCGALCRHVRILGVHLFQHTPHPAGPQTVSRITHIAAVYSVAPSYLAIIAVSRTQRRPRTFVTTSV